MKRGIKALSLIKRGQKLVHLTNIWFKPLYEPSYEYEKNNFNHNSMNTKQKFEALYIMFFANEFTTDITPTQRIYRFYVYYD